MTGLPGVHTEVKRVESLRLYDAISQAIADKAADEMPIVAHRKNDHPWLIVMLADDWFKMFREYDAGKTDDAL